MRIFVEGQKEQQVHRPYVRSRPALFRAPLQQSRPEMMVVTARGREGRSG